MRWNYLAGLKDHLEAELPEGILPDGANRAFISPTHGGTTLARKFKVIYVPEGRRPVDLFGCTRFKSMDEAKQAIRNYMLERQEREA